MGHTVNIFYNDRLVNILVLHTSINLRVLSAKYKLSIHSAVIGYVTSY